MRLGGEGLRVVGVRRGAGVDDGRERRGGGGEGWQGSLCGECLRGDGGFCVWRRGGGEGWRGRSSLCGESRRGGRARRGGGGVGWRGLCGLGEREVARLAARAAMEGPVWLRDRGARGVGEVVKVLEEVDVEVVDFEREALGERRAARREGGVGGGGFLLLMGGL